MQINTSRLTMQTLILSIGRFFNLAAAAGTLMVLSRVMPDKASYGTLCQLIMLYMVLSQIFAVGLPQSTYYFLPRYTGGQRRGFLTQVIILLTLSGGVLGGILYVGADTLGHVLNSAQLPQLLHIFAIYPVLMLPTLAVEGTLLHAQRPLATVFFNMAVRCGMFVALVVPACHHASIVQMVSTWMIFAVVMWAIALILMLSTVWHLPLVWEPQMLRGEWNFSSPLALAAIFGLSTTYVDRFLVSHLFGANGFAVYNNATIEIPTVSMVTNAVTVVLMTEFSRCASQGDFDGILPIWHGAMQKTAVFVFASLGFLAFWGNETVCILFSNRFIDSGGIFSIYIWSIPLRMLTLQPLFIARGATRVIIICLAIGFVIETAFIVTFGRLFGILGLALGGVIAAYLMTVFNINWYVNWTTKTGWRAFLPWKKLGTVLLIAVVAGGVSRLVLLLPHPSWAMIPIYSLAAVLFLLLYGIGLYLTHLLPQEIMTRLLPISKRLQREVTT